jgi:ATP-dependent DNA helicase PIF1
MRLRCPDLSIETQKEISQFSRWVLDIGEGNIENIRNDSEPGASWVRIPRDLLLMPQGDKITAIIQAVYPELSARYSDQLYLQNRAILTPTNEAADSINSHVVSLIPGAEREYLSSDRISKSPGTHESYDLMYPIEFLNSLNGNNFPHHRLVLKKGVPIMVLRNLDQSGGLCNGTRLIITNLGDMLIEAKIITGTHPGDIVHIPRICLTLKNTRLPFTLERRQFPIKVCYAMTINKSQGQTLANVGIYLKNPVFSHRQLYVAVSRVTSKHGLKMVIENPDGDCTDETQNIVYREIFATVPTAACA